MPRDSYKCQYLFHGSARLELEKDVRFTSECISVPIPEKFQKNNEVKVYIPYQYIKSISVFHPDLNYKGNHQYISYILINQASDRHSDIGKLFQDKSRIHADRPTKYDRKSKKVNGGKIEIFKKCYLNFFF